MKLQPNKQYIDGEGAIHTIVTRCVTIVHERPVSGPYGSYTVFLSKETGQLFTPDGADYYSPNSSFSLVKELEKSGENGTTPSPQKFEAWVRGSQVVGYYLDDDAEHAENMIADGFRRVILVEEYK